MSTAVMLIMLLTSTWIPVVFANSGLTIVSTFPEVATEIQRLLCPGDVVVSLVQPGIDPHEYQLRTSDIDVLKRADLVVSTGHTWFEHRIRELIEQDEIKATFIDLVEIPGLSIARNPATNTLNLHLPIRDPLNYILFVTNISETLVKLNPGKSECYMSNTFKAIRDVVNTVLPYKGVFKGEVIVDKPQLQYLVEWMGFKVAWVVRPEEDIEPTPLQIQEMERLFSNKSITLAFATYPATSSESRVLKELAEKYNVPLILIDTSSEKELVSILRDLVNHVSETSSHGIQETMTSTGIYQYSPKTLDYFNVMLLLLIGITTGVSISMLINTLKGRRQ